MCNRSLLILLFGIILVDMSTAQRHVTLEQTNGYKDTWTNINKKCSLLGTRRSGNMLKNKVFLDNINDLTGTGWISAHVEPQGTLLFLGCVTGNVIIGTSGLVVTHDRIPECIYFCGSSEILLHRNHCYCISNVYLHTSSCVASRCGNNEPLFCGQSETASSKCMCHYKRSLWSNSRNNLMAGSWQNENRNCTLKAHYSFSQFITTWHVICRKDHVQCDYFWNGHVMSEVFFWGTSSSVVGNQENCVATHKVNTSRRLTLITLPCSSKQTGICIRGSRISTTPHTTPLSTVIPTTRGYERLTSHKMLEPTTNDLVINHQSTIDDDTDTPPDTYTLPDTNTQPDTTTPLDTDTPSNITTMLNKIDSTTNIDGLTSTKSPQSSSKSMKTDQTNILGPVLGGVGTFVVLVIFGVVIKVILMKKRRRKADARSQPSHELNSLSTSKQHQNQYVNCIIEHQGGGQLNRVVDTVDYDALNKGRIDPNNAVYDHTSEAGDNMYGRLNQNGIGNDVSPENADIYEHSRVIVHVNGDTYDSFQTGGSREECSADYYDHTHVGEDYGYLEKRGNRKGQVDDIYDHTRGNGNSNGETYDTFQTGRGREDASEDCYDHTSVNAEYGCLQKGSKVTVLGDNDYDTVKVAKEDVQFRKYIL